MSRVPFVAGNWKMHKTIGESLELVDRLLAAVSGLGAVEVGIAPPFTALHAVHKRIAGTKLRLTAQNVHFESSGAFTGEISPAMLKDVGCQYVIIGHSERRTLFGETDEGTKKKVGAVLRAGLRPILCIGETLAERESGRAQAVLETQVRGALAKLSAEQKSAPILLAYEPVWAIGVNGIPATSDYADARQAEIIAVAEDVLGRRVPCLYGGSVNSDNCQELITCPHIDGLFIGRSAWTVEGYLDILAKSAAQL